MLLVAFMFSTGSVLDHGIAFPLVNSEPRIARVLILTFLRCATNHPNLMSRMLLAVPFHKLMVVIFEVTESSKSFCELFPYS